MTTNRAMHATAKPTLCDSTPAETGTRISARQLAALLRISVDDQPIVASVYFTTRRVHQAESLFRAGDAFQSLYVVRSGVMKTISLDESGAEQVMAFPMRGDAIGADGIASGRYASEAIALESSEVIVVPLATIRRFARECPSLEHLAFQLISRAIVQEQALLCIMGTLGAEGRVAAFLLALSEQMGALGYSRSSLVLRMTRQEIGSYLGLQLETVSRAFSAFAAAGLIRANLKQIDILDAAGLRRVGHEPVTVPQRAHAARVGASSKHRTPVTPRTLQSMFPFAVA
ncbi:MAG: helix-turn-helix domain-containing protein [Burkholderiales bacterium]